MDVVRSPGAIAEWVHPHYRRRAARFVAIGAVLVFLTLDLLAPLGTSHVVLEMRTGADSAGHAPFSTLSALTTVGTPHCPHHSPPPRAVGTLLGTTATRGSIAIVLPPTCRGRQVAFSPPLIFLAGGTYYATLGLVASSWTGAPGQVSVCVATSGHACTSTTLTLTSSTTAPLSTNVPALTPGNSYGPQIDVQSTGPGTATISLDLAVEQYQGSTGTPALVQQEWVQLTVTLG